MMVRRPPHRKLATQRRHSQNSGTGRKNGMRGDPVKLTASRPIAKGESQQNLGPSEIAVALPPQRNLRPPHATPPVTPSPLRLLTLESSRSNRRGARRRGASGSFWKEEGESLLVAAQQGAVCPGLGTASAQALGNGRRRGERTDCGGAWRARMVPGVRSQANRGHDDGFGQRRSQVASQLAAPAYGAAP